MAVRFDLRNHTLAGLAATVLAATVLALSGCGTAPAPGGGTTRPGGTPAPARITLTVTLTSGPGSAARHWTLRCDPPGGTHPDPAATCKALLRLKSPAGQPFAARSRHVMCPMIMMSDRQIVVTGTWNGVKVHRVIIDGGCDVALFGSMSKILR